MMSFPVYHQTEVIIAIEGRVKWGTVDSSPRLGCLTLGMKGGNRAEKILDARSAASTEGGGEKRKTLGLKSSPGSSRSDRLKRGGICHTLAFFTLASHQKKEEVACSGCRMAGGPSSVRARAQERGKE